MAKNGKALDARDDQGRFVTGTAGGPGRPKGSRSRLSEAFLADLVTAWEAHGAEVLERVIQEHPERFLSAVASTLPKDGRLELVNTEERRLIVQLDGDSKLAQRLKASGGVELLYEDPGELVEGECSVVDEGS